MITCWRWCNGKWKYCVGSARHTEFYHTYHSVREMAVRWLFRPKSSSLPKTSVFHRWNVKCVWPIRSRTLPTSCWAHLNALDGWPGLVCSIVPFSITAKSINLWIISVVVVVVVVTDNVVVQVEQLVSCVSSQIVATIFFDWNDLWPRYLVCRFTSTLSRSYSVVRVAGRRSRSWGKFAEGETYYAVHGGQKMTQLKCGP